MIHLCKTCNTHWWERWRGDPRVVKVVLSKIKFNSFSTTYFRLSLSRCRLAHTIIHKYTHAQFYFWTRTSDAGIVKSLCHLGHLRCCKWTRNVTLHFQISAALLLLTSTVWQWRLSPYVRANVCACVRACVCLLMCDCIHCVCVSVSTWMSVSVCTCACACVCARTSQLHVVPVLHSLTCMCVYVCIPVSVSLALHLFVCICG